MTGQNFENTSQPRGNAHPYTPNVLGTSHDSYRHNVRAPPTPSTNLENTPHHMAPYWQTNNQNANFVPMQFSSGVPAGPRREVRRAGTIAGTGWPNPKDAQGMADGHRLLY